MKIAVTAESSAGLESTVAEHFGHAPYFLFVDVDDGKISAAESVPSPFGGGHAPGEVPSFVKGRQADVILSGGMGGRAVAAFESLGIHATTGATGSVRAAIENYLKGDLTGAAPCNESVKHGHGA